MERREFCRRAGACLVGGCALGLTGCARALEWSSREGAGTSAAPTAAAPPATETPPGDGITTPEPATPDLAVFRGDDPAANVRKAVAALGGMERFVSRGARVLVKPNIINPRAPEYAVTTNPAVVGALVSMAYEAGARDVTVLDRPTAAVRNCYEVSGIAAAVDEAGGRMKVLTDRDYERFEIPEGRSLTSWPFVGDVFDADVFINVPIAKTHGLAGLTLSMKNLMGVMGGARGLIHQDFHQKIVDVNSLVRPHLVVLDAYRMLVRNGPTGGHLGDVKTAKTVVAGSNQASVDAFGATLFGRKPSDIDYIRRAGEQGLGETDPEALRVLVGTT